MATVRVMSAMNDAVVGSLTYNDGTLAITQVGVTLAPGLSVIVTVTDGVDTFTQTLTQAATTWNVQSAHLTMVTVDGRIGVPHEWSFTVS